MGTSRPTSAATTPARRLSNRLVISMQFAQGEIKAAPRREQVNEREETRPQPRVR